ncbi:RHS repeat-associated core domain-containing protein [Gemmatimonas sp.]
MASRVDWPTRTQGRCTSRRTCWRAARAGHTWFGTLAENGAGSAGLLYKRNRYFDPASGRFTQADPIGLGGGLNLYGFANGDPVNFSDPYGLCPIPISSCLGLEGADLAAGSTPGFSTLLDFATAITGKNWITGEQVGPAGRLIAVAGLITPAGGGEIRAAGKMIGFTGHGVDQVINRGIKPEAIWDAFKNPLKVGPIKYDEYGRPSQRIVGRNATVAQNPETGKIVSVNPTGTKLRQKLEGQQR